MIAPELQDDRTFWLDHARAQHRVKPASPGFIDVIRRDRRQYRLEYAWEDVLATDPHLRAELFEIADRYARKATEPAKPRRRSILDRILNR